MEEENEAVATFQAITGADAATAQHVLEAHGWDLNRGVNFFVESSNAPSATLPVTQDQPRAPAGGGAGMTEVVDVASDDDEDRAGPPPSFTAAAAAAIPPPSDFDDEDQELRAALDASLRTEDGEAGGPADFQPTTRHRWASRYEDDDDGEDESLADRRARIRGQSQGVPSGLSSDDEKPGRRVRRNRPRGAAAPDPFLGTSPSAVRGRGSTADAQRGWPPALIVDGEPVDAAPGFPPPGGLGPGGYGSAEENGLSHLPDGINMEEARMLEAAMLGVPYEGRIPDFNNPTPPEPVSPTVMHHRQLREEQDQAYQDSLQADQLKADAAEMERRAAEEQQQEQQRREEDAAQAHRSYEQDIEGKLLGLPQEPGAGEEGVVTLLVRTPQGGRFGRRFRRSDRLASLFDFVDVSAAPDYRPGQYRLVTQFPRRVLAPDTPGTLEDNGLSQKQEAVFLELL